MKKEKVIMFSLFILFFVAISISLTNRSIISSSSSTKLAPTSSFKSGIAIIELYGPIGFPSRPVSISSPIANTLKQLNSIKDDSRVKAVIIRINSPGGTVGASQELYHAILSVKKARNIPIVISIADMAASGGYYVALAGDTIFANEGSLVGSVGVIMGNMDFSEVQDRYGIGFNVVKSGPYKDVFSSWRKPSAADKALLQSMVDNVQSQFVASLQNSRNLKPTTAKQVAKGGVYSGQQALEMGLVDYTGTFQDAITFTAKTAGLPAKPHLIYKSKPSVYDLMDFWSDQIGSLFSLSWSAPSILMR